VTVSYKEVRPNGEVTGGTFNATLNGTTEVDISPTPSGGSLLDVDFIAVSNSDSASVTVTLRLKVSATAFALGKFTLAAGETAQYVRGTGMNVIKATGAAGGGAGGGTDDQTAAEVPFTATGGIVATDVQAAIAELDTEKAPLASPTFTGTVTIPTPFTLGAVSVLPTGTELNFVDGVTSSIQTQIDAKAALASPTFTGTVTIPTPFTLGAVSVLPTGTELNFVDGVTSSIQTQLDAKAPLASPTFTGTVTLPTPFTLGAVSVLPTGTELNFVDGVTSSIQTQLDAKAALASPTFTGTPAAPTATLGTNTTQLATTAFVIANAGSAPEYGTFTPTIIGESTAGAGTYIAQAGNYTKIGRMVHVQGYVDWSAHTGTGNMAIGALPYTSISGTNRRSGATFGYVDSIALSASNYLGGE
jgi:hypothetical protein